MRESESEPSKEPVTAPTSKADTFLLGVVFLAGMGTLGIEMMMPRLLAPFFGTSQPIWAVVIGMTLIYLATGYHLGGQLADRRPDQRLVYVLIAWAGFFCGLIPVLSRPILGSAQQALSSFAAGGFLAALLGVILLFAAPVILLAMVGPFAVRLQLHRTRQGVLAAGRTAGTISSLSTLGSILGTFLPVLVFIPWIGTQRTIYLFSMFLLLIGIVGARAWRLLWMILVVMALTTYTLLTTAQIRSADCRNCTLIAEAESPYNYIQVIAQDYFFDGPDPRLLLRLNEGHANHSVYRLRFEETGDPRDLLTGGPWDYFAVAPYFYPNRHPQSIRSLAVLGAAAGTIPRQYLAIYGPDQVHVDAVEIDPEIIRIGKRYFTGRGAAHIANYTTHVQDARYWLATTHARYDVIGMDAYHQPYIPFHLTTVEFFRETRAHLHEQGVVVVNAGRPPSGDDRLVNALASTMRTVFPQVFLIDSRLPQSTSVLIVGVNQWVGEGVAHFAANAAQMTNPALQIVMRWAMHEGAHPIREFLPEQARFAPFTDDRAPVELLIDALVLSEAGKLRE